MLFCRVLVEWRMDVAEAAYTADNRGQSATCGSVSVNIFVYVWVNGRCRLSWGRVGMREMWWYTRHEEVIVYIYPTHHLWSVQMTGWIRFWKSIRVKIRVRVSASYSTCSPRRFFDARVLLNAVGGAVCGEQVRKSICTVIMGYIQE